MGRKLKKLPYVAFVIRSLVHLFSLTISISFCAMIWEDAKGLQLKLILLMVPSVAIVIAFFDLRFRFRELQEFKRQR